MFFLFFHLLLPGKTFNEYVLIVGTRIRSSLSSIYTLPNKYDQLQLQLKYYLIRGVNEFSEKQENKNKKRDRNAVNQQTEEITKN